jgi:hypothetical protein
MDAAANVYPDEGSYRSGAANAQYAEFLLFQFRLFFTDTKVAGQSTLD